MILVDANILLYAEDKLSPCHETARSWWDTQLSDASLDQAAGCKAGWINPALALSIQLSDTGRFSRKCYGEGKLLPISSRTLIWRPSPWNMAAN